MSLARRSRAALGPVALALVALISTDVAAESLRDMTRVATIRPAKGFVDTPIAVEPSGKRLAYVTTNAADSSTLHVLDLETGKNLHSFGIESLKATPIAVAFVGDQIFVVGKRNRGREVGTVYALDGSVARSIGGADRVRPTLYKGRQVAALYSKRKRGARTIHEAEAIDLSTGKRVGKRGRLETDAAGLDKRRRMKVNHWENENLVAVGTIIGAYNRKADQRMPDEAGRYDLAADAIAEHTQIRDLIAQRRHFLTFETRSNEERFVALSRDRRSLARYDTRSLKPTPVTLAEPFNHYNASSLKSIKGPDGSVFFTLTIDPVHPAAAAARRAVPEWLDVYELPSGATRAIRRARWLVDETRELRWVATSSHWVVVPAHVGFSRGGPQLAIFRFDATSATSKK